MPFQAIETRRLYQQVADQIGALIRSGEFAPGQRLPPERDLARNLGVSRPVVREAMIALELAGLVEVRTGSGTYIGTGTDEVGRSFTQPDIGPSPFDVIAARVLIEGETAFLAASAAAEADIDRVGETLEMMRAAIADGRNTQHADRLFHTRIAAATGNSVLPSIVDQLWAAMFAPMFETLRQRTGLIGNQQMTLDDHARIVEALRRRDASAARDTMRAHLEQVRDVLLREESIPPVPKDIRGRNDVTET